MYNEFAVKVALVAQFKFAVVLHVALSGVEIRISNRFSVEGL